MTSLTSDVEKHIALLAQDVREGTGLDIEPWWTGVRPVETRSEAEAARENGFASLSVSHAGFATRHVGTPLSFLNACWAVARGAMPSLPDISDAAVFATERAALTGRRPTPPFSAGGACRAMRATDGWWALSLAREDDLELIPALTGLPVDDPWRQLEEVSARHSVSALVLLARDLGLPASAVGAEVSENTARPFRWEWPGAARMSASIRTPGPPGSRRLRVLDLTGLWAGPLCGSLLALAGCDVVKVESRRRPDGARDGEPRFFDLLNVHKRCVALDFDEDRELLAALVAQADVILEGSRPEALASRGIHAADEANRGGVWVRVSAYPTDPDPGLPSRVGFGDDVALGAGLRVDTPHDDALPCGDAVADPLTGIAALAALAVTLKAIATGARAGGCVLEVPMVHVAARVAHLAASTATRTALGEVLDEADTVNVPVGHEAASVLRGRTVEARAHRLGADTADVLRDWCDLGWHGE